MIIQKKTVIWYPKLISPALPGIHRQNRGFYFLKRNLCYQLSLSESTLLLFTRKLDTCCQAVRQRLYHARLQPHASKMHLKWAVIVTAHTVCVNSNSTFTGFPLVFTNNKFSNSPFISSCIGLTIIFRNSNWLFIASSASGTNINSENPEVAFGVFTVDVYTN